MPLPNDDRDGLRRCRDCGAWKPLEQFHTSPRRPSGRGSYCQPCYNVRSKASYAKRRYGIGQEEFEQLLAAQGGVCGICGAERPEHVDHDHLTGYSQLEIHPGVHMMLSPRRGMHPVGRPAAGGTR